MANMTRTDALPFLEEMYINTGLLNELVYRDRPLLAILEKAEKQLGGKYLHVPVLYVTPQGRSSTFTNAQTNTTPSKRKSFDVTYRNNYGVGAVDGDVITDARGNTTLLTDALADEMDKATETLANDISTEIFRNFGGFRGRLSHTTTLNTPTITLSAPEDTINFEIGQVLQVASTDGTSGAVRTGTVTLTGVDRIAGTLTEANNWNADIAAIAVDDFIFVQGDFGNKMAGLSGWDPSAAPTATLWFNVDRTADTRLGGLRLPANLAGSIDQILIQAAAVGGRFGAKFDLGVLNPVKFGDLTLALETQNRRIRTATVMGSGDAARFGFDAILLATDRGDIPIISDPSCPIADARLLRSDGIKLAYSGSGFMHIINDDGNDSLRQTTADGIEFRLKSRGNMAVYNPGHQMYVGV